VEVVFRRSRERAGWSCGDAVRARDRRRWTGKKDLQTPGLSSAASQLFSRSTDPAQLKKARGAARWHEGCPQAGALTATRRGQARAGAGAFAPGRSQRDRAAAGWHTTPHCLTSYSVPKGPASGECRHDQNKGGRFLPDRTDNVCCVPSRKQSRHPASQRILGVRSVVSAGPSCQRAAKPVFTSPGRVSRRRRASANAIFLTPRRQSVGRGLRRDGNVGALGRPARSLPPWCQTNLVLSVRAASFAK
jgi:hypothetical protein